MAQLQKQFETFHDTIKLDNYDENAKLREKRDLLLKELREKYNTKRLLSSIGYAPPAEYEQAYYPEQKHRLVESGLTQ